MLGLVHLILLRIGSGIALLSPAIICDRRYRSGLLLRAVTEIGYPTRRYRIPIHKDTHIGGCIIVLSVAYWGRGKTGNG